jgi:hypothetical protein
MARYSSNCCASESDSVMALRCLQRTACVPGATTASRTAATAGAANAAAGRAPTAGAVQPRRLAGAQLIQTVFIPRCFAVFRLASESSTMMQRWATVARGAADGGKPPIAGFGWKRSRSTEYSASNRSAHPDQFENRFAVGQRRVREDDLAPGQAPQHGVQPTLEDQHRLRSGNWCVWQRKCCGSVPW